MDKPEINAFDTETEKGNIFLIADAYGHYLRKEDKDDSLSIADLLTFLWENGKSINFFFNLDFDFGAVLKPYLVNAKDEALAFKKLKKLELFGYKLYYIPSKGFIITVNKHKKSYFDISNFYADNNKRLSLNELAKIYLNDQKLDMNRQVLGDDIAYYLKHKDEVTRYCIHDAELTKGLAEIYVQSIHDLLGVYPKYYFSRASISKVYLELNHPDLANSFEDIPLFLKRKIRQAYRGGIFSVNILGKVDNVMDIDINSAYPFQIAHMPKWQDLDFKLTDKFERNAIMGIYEVAIKYDGTIPYRTNTNLVIYPRSNKLLRAYFTQKEVEYFLESGKNIRVKWGYVAFAKDNYRLEFPDIISLYERRQELKKDKSIKSQLQQWNIKIIMNAVYGCFAQTKGGFTKWTNLMLASYITGNTRVKIWKEMDKLGRNNIIQIATDGILFKITDENKKIAESYTDTHELGEFSVSGKYAWEITYMNGIYILAKENDNKIELKKRGMPLLKAEDLLNAKGSEITISQKKVHKLLESLAQHKAELIDVFDNIPKKLDLKANLMKADYDVSKLTFEYLNKHELKGIPILVVEPEKYVIMKGETVENKYIPYSQLKKMYQIALAKRRDNLNISD